jgi:serine/threonine-protein kinase
MSQSSHRALSDRNLLFGILAVQMNFVCRDDLVAGVTHWVQHKETPLGEILRQQGKLTNSQVAALDAVIVQYVALHGQEPLLGLQALSGASTVASAMTPIEDEDVRAAVAQIMSLTEPRTTTYVPAAAAGRYRKLHLHQEGGQGQIYRAEDSELERPVALKEIKPQFADDPQTRQRFLLEARVTGQLQHPGVVPVYGLGTEEDGRPYYAMRFISEERLTDAINEFYRADRRTNPGERRLRFGRLLRRFVDVCNAVAYAHDRGVIHRDLKPGNIMLGRYGETLVIDWGMAKAGVAPRRATAPDDEPAVAAGDGDLDATRPGGVKGTFAYMSPEQAFGNLDLVGKASDIYSLGATLYQLLTGRPAFVGSSADRAVAGAEVQAKVKKGAFPPPIEVRADVPPALDAICLKAMAFKPADRYASVLDLAADVEHWLADEPVAAYPEPWTARAARWARRHQRTVVGVAASAAVAVVALAISTVLVSAEQRETARQRNLADAKHRLARAQFLSSVELIQAGDVYFASDPALYPRRKELLRAAEQGCREFFQQGADDWDMQKHAAVVYRYSANVHRGADETKAAAPLYRDAIRLYEGLAEQFPDDAAPRARLAESLRDEAGLFMKLGRYREAKAGQLRAAALQAELQKTAGAHPSYLQIEAMSLVNQGHIAHRMGEPGAADKVDQGIAIYEKLVKLPAPTGHPYNPLLLILAMNQRAVIERDGGDLKKARVLHQAILKRVNELLVKDAAGVAPADYFNIKALCALEQSRTLARVADEKPRKAAEINFGLNAQQWEALAQLYPWIPYYRDRQAAALRARGQLRLQDRRLKEAADDFEAARRLLEALTAKHAEVADYQHDLGLTYAGLGGVAAAQARPDDAARWIGQARAALDRAMQLAPDDVHIQKDARALPQ